MDNEGLELLNLYREVSGKYYDLIGSGDPDFSLELMSFDCQVDSQEIIWGTYEEEFTRSIVNDFNKFVSCLYKINLLEKIISNYDEDEHNAFNLRTEFIHVLLHYCLNGPYEFVGRIQYCCIILCNQANHLIFDIEDSLEEENKYGYEKLKLASKRWKSREGLLQALKSVANWNTDFVQATDHYRNKTQHQLPPNLDVGLSNSVNKKLANSNDLLEQIRTLHGIQPDQKFVTYEFGGKPPLKTADMIPVLVQQGEEMRKLFYRYWDLVVEQNEAINARCNPCTDSSER